MKTAPQWFEEYSRSHQNQTNQRIHMVAVPLIYWSIIFALTTLPPLALALLFPALTFYFALGWGHGFAMVIFTLAGLMLGYSMTLLGWPVPYVAGAIFIMAWIAQFYGHKVEGKKPSFLTDLLFLLIGPLWVLDKVSRALPRK